MDSLDLFLPLAQGHMVWRLWEKLRESKKLDSALHSTNTLLLEQCSHDCSSELASIGMASSPATQSGAGRPATISKVHVTKVRRSKRTRHSGIRCLSNIGQGCLWRWEMWR